MFCKQLLIYSSYTPYLQLLCLVYYTLFVYTYIPNHFPCLSTLGHITFSPSMMEQGMSGIIIRLIFISNHYDVQILKVAGALTHDFSWSSIFLEGEVLTYSLQLPYWDIRVSQTISPSEDNCDELNGLGLLPGGHPSNYQRSQMLLNFWDLTGSGVSNTQ